MSPITDIEIQANNTGYACRLLWQGHDMKLVLRGGRLIGVWQQETGHVLLLLNDNSGFEDLLHIYLLNHSKNKDKGNGWQVVDALSIGQYYSPGDTENIHTVDANTMQFTFPNAAHCWKLTVLSPPQWHWPWAWGLREVRHHTLRCKTWLHCVKTPCAE